MATSPDSSAPSPGQPGLLLLAALVFAVSFLFFWRQTIPVRLACTDDRAFQEVARHGAPGPYLAEIARQQARFFFAIPFYEHLLLSPYRIDSDAVFSLLRAVVFFTQAGLLGGLAARLAQNPFLGWAVALLVVATVHLPATFYPILSFPGISAGFIALLASLHFHLSALRRPGAVPALLAAVLLLVACLCTEYFLCLTPAFVAVSLHHRGRRWRAVARDVLGPGVAGVAFVAVYLLFAHRFPSSYDGTQFSLNLPAAAKILSRQFIGLTPGFELLVQRGPLEAGAPLFRPVGDILAGFAFDGGLLLGLLQGGVLVALLLGASRRPTGPSPVWPWLAGFAVFANVPIMFSAKYQVFLFHREYPYVYAFFSFCILAWAFADFVTWVSAQALVPRRRALALAGAGIVLACVSAAESNRHTLGLLHQWYN